MSFLNKNFINLYEQLSVLNESTDTGYREFAEAWEQSGIDSYLADEMKKLYEVCAKANNYRYNIIPQRVILHFPVVNYHEETELPKRRGVSETIVKDTPIYISRSYKGITGTRIGCHYAYNGSAILKNDALRQKFVGSESCQDFLKTLSANKLDQCWVTYTFLDNTRYQKVLDEPKLPRIAGIRTAIPKSAEFEKIENQNAAIRQHNAARKTQLSKAMSKLLGATGDNYYTIAPLYAIQQNIGGGGARMNEIGISIPLNNANIDTLLHSCKIIKT